MCFLLIWGIEREAADSAFTSRSSHLSNWCGWIYAAAFLSLPLHPFFSLCLSTFFVYLSLHLCVFTAFIFADPRRARPCAPSAFHVKKRSRVYWSALCRGVNLGSLTALTICFYDAIAGCGGVIEFGSSAAVPGSRKGVVYLHGSGRHVKRFLPKLDKDQLIWACGCIEKEDLSAVLTKNDLMGSLTF